MLDYFTKYKWIVLLKDKTAKNYWIIQHILQPCRLYRTELENNIINQNKKYSAYF